MPKMQYLVVYTDAVQMAEIHRVAIFDELYDAMWFCRTRAENEGKEHKNIWEFPAKNATGRYIIQACIEPEPEIHTLQNGRGAQNVGLMTIREMLASSAMQGIIAAETEEYGYRDEKAISDAAVRHADALLSSLSQ